MDENRIILLKEIDLIQSILSRLSQNSFLVKGWAISVVVGILALSSEKAGANLACWFAIISTCCFWFLDAFFLKTERLYRWKYNWVIQNRLHTQDFSYDLNPHNSKMWIPEVNSKSQKEPVILRMMLTKSLLPIYLPLILFLILILILNSIK